MVMKEYIWEGSVGIVIEPMKKKDGTHFWTYKFTRYVKKDDGSEDYYDTFSDRNDEAIDVVKKKGFDFRQENNADEWIKQHEARKERGPFDSPENTQVQPTA